MLLFQSPKETVTLETDKAEIFWVDTSHRLIEILNDVFLNVAFFKDIGFYSVCKLITVFRFHSDFYGTKNKSKCY